MPHVFRYAFGLRLLLCLLAIVAFVGCGSGNTEQSYHPPAASARDALTAGLKAWQDGREKPGLIDTTTPHVQIADPIWSDGKKLKSFEIVKEEPTPSGPGKFTVKLTVDGLAEAQNVVYVVIGKDPLWIFREEEYQRGGGM